MKRKLFSIASISILFVIFCLSNGFSADWLPKNGWHLLYVDSQEFAGENGAAANAFDGTRVPSGTPNSHEPALELRMKFRSIWDRPTALRDFTIYHARMILEMGTSDNMNFM